MQVCKLSGVDLKELLLGVIGLPDAQRPAKLVVDCRNAVVIEHPVVSCLACPAVAPELPGWDVETSILERCLDMAGEARADGENRRPWLDFEAGFEVWVCNGFDSVFRVAAVGPA